MVSIGPPGGNGTIILIGLSGYDCASACVAKPAPNAIPNAMPLTSSARLPIMAVLPETDGGRFLSPRAPILAGQGTPL